jgi:Flp pilus assembly protein CpaB
MLTGTLSRYRWRNTAIAGGLAVLGAILVLIYVASYRNHVQKGAELVSVYAASRDIPEGTDGASVAGSYLTKESVLRRNVIGGAISNPSQIATLAASETIYAGEQITLRQFHPAAEQGVLANISGNQRAMTLPGDPNQLLANVVTAGDHVDVLANIPYVVRPPGGTAAAAEGDFRRVASRIILRDLLVLRPPGGTGGSGTFGANSNTTSITLALTDTQAQNLLFAVKNGDWWLVLRPIARPADSSESVETIESILADGIGQNGISQLTGGYGPGSIGSGQ